uniref:di-N-acetylchitobiase-like n=1 Tax=Pristiophorus japonicus TaxID=55135 RepID=UPI00398E3DE8
MDLAPQSRASVRRCGPSAAGEFYSTTICNLMARHIPHSTINIKPERMRLSLALAQVLALAVLWVAGESNTSIECQCSNPSLCQPVAAHIQHQVEVVVFDIGGKDWKHYDWSQVTTIIPVRTYDPEILCRAHANDVRVLLIGRITQPLLYSPAVRALWINEQIQVAKRQFMDGIIFSYQQTLSAQSVFQTRLIELIRDTARIFHREIPGSQVTFIVPWAPNCIEGQCYDFASIAKHCDILFVRSYDMHTQTINECFASPNAIYHQVVSGLSAYIKLGIESRKLVLGLAWSGYDYTCKRFFEPGRCELERKNLMRAPCSYHAARPVSYKDIMKLLPKSFTGKYWDEVSRAPYLNYMVNITYHEVWFDDPESISIKASILMKLKLRGIGMWNANDLDYSAVPLAAMQTEDMWNAMCPFRGKWRA